MTKANVTRKFQSPPKRRDFFGESWLFWLLRLINSYLLTYLLISFLLITIYGISMK